MAKFNAAGTRTKVQSPIKTTGQTAPTFEGGAGCVRDAKGELFMTAVSTLAGEDSFYESGADRLNRVSNLVRQVTAEDPKWMQDFLPWLRGPEGNLRTISIAMAVDYAKAGGPDPRKVVASVLQRADEPGEAIAYLFSRYGKKLGGGLQRGIADAAVRLFNEHSAQKYDGSGSNTVRLGDVIELTHPKAKTPEQHALFQYLLDRRHHASNIRAELAMLGRVSETTRMGNIPEAQRRDFLRSNPGALKDAGWTWERLSGWLPGGMDAEAWEFILGPDASGMGYMALLRNLRNFSDAGISDALEAKVCARISDPEQVAKSRQFPFRFLSAFENSPIQYAAALEKALLLSTQNIPDLSGTLVVIDTSGSMTGMGYSQKGSRTPLDIAAVMAQATVARSKDCDVAIFGDGAAMVTNLKPTDGILRGVEKIRSLSGSVGHGSYGWSAVQAFYNPAKHKRAIIFTDGQLHDGDPGRGVCPNAYMFAIGGYRVTPMDGQPGRFEAGGFTDATFRLIDLLERGRDGRWPWMGV